MPNPRVLIITDDKPECQKLITCSETLGYHSLAMDEIRDIRRQVRRFEPDVMLINRSVIKTSFLDFVLALPSRRSVMLGLITDNPDTIEQIDTTQSQRIHLLDAPVQLAQIRTLLRQVIKSEQRRRRRKPRAQQFELLVGSSQPMQQVYTQIAKAAPTDATILICGQSGTGKELVARSIHNRSERSDKRFVAVNCGAIPDSLIESELFGCEKGSYTGADRMRKGVFERAQNGTLFLDEITEMAMEAQIRLLRVLEERAVTRIGGDRAIKLNVRVIAATNRDPMQAIKDGQLREDLHYRLAVFPLNIPRLADREDDVMLLASHFLTKLNKAEGKSKSLSATATQRLYQYDWPGNVRQLRNMIYREFIMADQVLEMDTLKQLIDESNQLAAEKQSALSTSPATVTQDATPSGNALVHDSSQETGTSSDQQTTVTLPVGTTLDEAEKQLILKTLEECDNNRTLAAQTLGISVKTLYNRLKDYES